MTGGVPETIDEYRNRTRNRGPDDDAIRDAIGAILASVPEVVPVAA